LRATVAKSAEISQRMKVYFDEWFRRFDAFCDKPTRETARAYLSYGMEKDTRTCRVRTNPWQETFTRSLGGKWVSNRGPSGNCSVVIVSTLEPEDPKEPPSENALWTYSWKAKEFDRSCAFVEFEMQ
jgi:hypothetical protein